MKNLDQKTLDKKVLKATYLKPKAHLKTARQNRGLTTTQMAQLIGLKNRRQYEQKEGGKAPFHDYEMLIIAQYFEMTIEQLFYED